MIDSLGTETAKPTGKAVDHLIHRPSEVVPFAMGDDRFVPVHGKDPFDLLEMLLDLEHQAGARDPGVVPGQLSDELLRAGLRRVGDLTVAGGDLDSHMLLR